MKALTLSLLLSCSAIASEAVVLTDAKGRAITVTITAVNEAAVEVMKDGKPFTIKRADLDAVSQQIVSNFIPKPGAADVRLSMRAKTASTSRSADEKWKTSWGSYDRDIYRARCVVVDVQCTKGSEDGHVVIQWIGSVAGRASDKGIVLTDKQAIKLQPGGGGQFTFDALFVESDANYESLEMRDRDGLKYVGWIARVFGADARLLAEQGSNPVYLTGFAPTLPQDIE